MPTPKAFPGAVPPLFHYGITIQRGGQSLYLYDHRDTNRNWKGAVTIESTPAQITRANVADFDFSNLTVPNGEHAKHAIIHKEESSDLYTTDDHELIVLRVSTVAEHGSAHRDLNNPAAIVEFSMKDGNAYRLNNGWLDQFLGLDFETAKELAGLKGRTEVSDELDEKYSKFLDIILPGDPTANLAFRLLCEAKIACGNSPTAELHGKAIHAPTGLDDWLRPFAPLVGDDTAKISTVIGRMADAEAKNAATKVLEAVRDAKDVLAAAATFPGLRTLPTTLQEGGVQ